MTNPVLIIYDNTGRIWGMYHGETTVPEGVQGVVVDAPRNFNGASVNPVTKEVTWVLAEDTEAEVESVQDAVIDHEERLLALEEALEAMGGNA